MEIKDVVYLLSLAATAAIQFAYLKFKIKEHDEKIKTIQISSKEMVSREWFEEKFRHLEEKIELMNQIRRSRNI